MVDHPASGCAAQGRAVPGRHPGLDEADREAVGRWIEGQADRAEGKRILGALPRLAQGKGYVWVPSDGVLARVAFPRIRNLDSSRTPQRDERIATPRTLALIDLSVIIAALFEMEGGAADKWANATPD